MRMRIDYGAEAVHLNLMDRPIKDSAEVADGIIFDYDADGHVVGIEILPSSTQLKKPKSSGARVGSSVGSSVIASVEYDDDAQELDITFTSGKIYRYFDVPADIHAGLVDAESPGKFFNKEIKDAYRFEELKKRRR
jgi:uncharacterized protein YuzE